MKYLLTLTILAAGLALTGCEQDGPFEEAGESLDNATAEFRENAEDACENIEDGTKTDLDC